VSVALRTSEVLFLRGASGAGKTTLLGIAAGLVLPTSGEVRFQGEAFSRLRESFRASVRRESMGVVLQGLALVARMTVLENVLLPNVPDGTLDRDAIARAEALLDRFGMLPLARAHIENLSGGERQRAALARALLGPRSLVLLDEPTAHLDAQHADTLVGLIAERRRSGAMFCIATHDARLSSVVADARSVEIADGVVVSQDLPSTVP
jgi:putative ABC transport system ATP-binding protein